MCKKNPKKPSWSWSNFLYKIKAVAQCWCKCVSTVRYQTMESIFFSVFWARVRLPEKAEFHCIKGPNKTALMAHYAARNGHVKHSDRRETQNVSWCAEIKSCLRKKKGGECEVLLFLEGFFFLVHQWRRRGWKRWRERRKRRCVCVCVRAIRPLLSRCWVQCLIDSLYSSSVRLGQLKGVTTHGCEQ